MDPTTYAYLIFAIVVLHNVVAVSVASSSTDRQLFFGLMLGDQSEGALSGIEAALDEINSGNDLLLDYRLNYNLINSEAVSYISMHAIHTHACQAFSVACRKGQYTRCYNYTFILRGSKVSQTGFSVHAWFYNI